MGIKNSDESYRRYKQYRVNRYRFRTEQVSFPIAMLIVIGIISKFWYLIVLGIVVFIVHQISKYLMEVKKTVILLLRRKEKKWRIFTVRKAEK